MRGASGAHGRFEWSPADAPVFNPAFDVTPAALVTAWILDSGIYRQRDVEQGIFKTSNSRHARIGGHPAN